MEYYKIEWAVAWNPKRSEQECIDYINKRYPQAVYGNWVAGNPKIKEYVKEVYATPEEAEYKSVLCTITKSTVKPHLEVF